MRLLARQYGVARRWIGPDPNRLPRLEVQQTRTTRSPKRMSITTMCVYIIIARLANDDIRYWQSSISGVQAWARRAERRVPVAHIAI